MKLRAFIWKGGNMNDITDLLNLEDHNLQITNIRRVKGVKEITVETTPTVHYCPLCGFRMHSRGVKTRTVNHPILQDTYQLVVKLKQRRWRCTNPICRYEEAEAFRFVNRYRRSSNATDLLIVEAFRDLANSAASIAKKFHTTDTHVLEVFDKYVRMERLPLTDAISVDEVYLDMDNSCKYVLVLQDFHTGQPIDLIRSRRDNVTAPFFSSIPIEERRQVKYLITDMYNPYLAYVEKYFPNAVSVVDSFHVIQWITHSLDMFLRQLLREYKLRDQERQDKLSREQNRPMILPKSDEVYLLQNYRWLLLGNRRNIIYHAELRMDNHFRYYMNSYDYEKLFMDLHPDMRELRDLKEMYVEFNDRNAGDPDTAAKELDKLIVHYWTCGHQMFKEFAILLKKYHDPIINSFVMVQRIGPDGIYDSRLSNGPIESLNRKAKDLKRSGRGYRNFSHLRNRFLFSTRYDPVLNGKERKPVIYDTSEDE